MQKPRFSRSGVFVGRACSRGAFALFRSARPLRRFPLDPSHVLYDRELVIETSCATFSTAVIFLVHRSNRSPKKGCGPIRGASKTLLPLEAVGRRSFPARMERWCLLHPSASFLRLGLHLTTESTRESLDPPRPRCGGPQGHLCFFSPVFVRSTARVAVPERSSRWAGPLGLPA